MKILELRFKNLNALTGEWCIDFTNPEYVDHGIFALTGPTGAGKSTILDAICLALYGTTPRLGRVTKSDNGIISRHTGECYAEVLFESHAGRFRTHWAQHRARKKSSGDLQQPHHEIAQGVDQGQVIAHQSRRVAAVVEEKTGMDFERFTRSMLLAQGGFDTFLKADDEQKSKILEQITGTKIYTEISCKVHERQRTEHEKLDLLQAEISGITILDAVQEAEIEQQLKRAMDEEPLLVARISETNSAIAWLTNIEKLQHAILSLDEALKSIQAKLELFKPKRAQLAQADKAAQLDGEYATLAALRTQQKADQISLTNEQAKLPQQEASTKQRLAALQAAEQHILTAKERLTTSAPLIQRIRLLDQTLANLDKNLQQNSEECHSQATKIREQTTLQSQQQDQYNRAHTALKRVQKELDDHAVDANLIGDLGSIEVQLNQLLAAQHTITQITSNQQSASDAIANATQQCKRHTDQLNDQRAKVTTIVTKITQQHAALTALLNHRLLREYRTEKETLLREMALLTKITELKAHRTQLEDGKPCPLCGAKQHPYAEGNTPQPDAVEQQIAALSTLIHHAETLEAAIKQLEHEEKQARQTVTDHEKLEAAAAHEKTSAENRLADLNQALQTAHTNYRELRRLALRKLQPLGITDVIDSTIPSLLQSLQDRLQAWLTQTEKHAAITATIHDLTSALQQHDAVIATHAMMLDKQRDLLAEATQHYHAEQAKRTALFGSKSPEEEERKLHQAIANTEQEEREARAIFDQTRQTLLTSQGNIRLLTRQIETSAHKRKPLEAQFIHHLQELGFDDEAQFLSVKLTEHQRNELILQAKKLDDQQTDLRTRHNDRNEQLSAEKVKNITNTTLELLLPARISLEESLTQLRQSIAALRHQCDENRAAKARINTKQAGITAQKKESLRWQNLHSLIGSADGKKYRNFAQGLTFELMVSHANRQLEKMSDRYLLVRDDEHPLMLNVIDNFQAGAIRSTNNLSGGESFIVSLTLALGLSKMASRTVRVDSLFLDEGFGSLDEETLEIALDTLASLQHDGKLIGVISHVPALKERISTQIQVHPQSGGKSTISGPGCRQIK
ncbi:MAG: AAA family ATPase [Mariprofundales bacterium]